MQPPLTGAYDLRMHAGIEGFVMPSRDDLESVAGRLRLLSDPTRLRVLCALAQGESDVGCLTELAEANGPTVSQHLAKLRLAGVVKPHREGQRMIYELVDPVVRALLVDLLDVSVRPPGVTAGERSS
jgi:DNA-binding transcriptional ArsR family regulator